LFYRKLIREKEKDFNVLNKKKKREESISNRYYTEFLLLFDESAVEGVSDGIVKKLEAVEDLDGASSLYSNHATVYSGRGGSRASIAAAVGLRLDTSVVIGYVDYYERV
jgi:hypothetical protein